LQEVHWGGNPDKARIKDEKGLSPRKSFELWKQVKKCESNMWQKPELFAAASFANALQKQVHMMFLTREELKHRRLSEKLIEANSELENLNWIGSHDLKEPLRKIQLFASRILEEDVTVENEVIWNAVKKMSKSATRMQLLITDILSYSKLSHIEEGFRTVNLNNLVKTVIEELSLEISEKRAVVEHNTLPDIKGISFLLQQLMVNLIRNALKFAKPEVAPHITIHYSGEQSSLPEGIQSTGTFKKIIVKDNGIGFDNQFKEAIFKVFTRLHDSSEYSGSGVGLALCRKIMRNHNGYIFADSTPGSGSVFSLYFPVVAQPTNTSTSE
jgi:light-regulated signal transduction histidine kinase (bacteriophytochrome)